MRLSELIKKLQQTLETEGDLPTFEGDGNYFAAPFQVVTEISDSCELAAFSKEDEKDFSLTVGSKFLLV